MGFELQGSPKITIDLQPGVYVFEPVSATGKTRLVKALAGATVDGALVMSYEHYQVNPKAVVENLAGPYKLVVIDRFDLWYKDEAVRDAIVANREGRITLIDCKSGRFGLGIPTAFVRITLSPSEVHVAL